MENKEIKVEVPFDFKKHFERFNNLFDKVKERLEKFKEEYSTKSQNDENDVLFAYLQEIHTNFNNIMKELEKINKFFNSNLSKKEFKDLNKLLSINIEVEKINENFKNVIEIQKKLEEEKFQENLEKLVSLKSDFIDRLQIEVKTMDKLLSDFVEKKIENFEKKIKNGFENQIDNLNNKFTEDFAKSYDDTLKKLENLNTVTKDKVTFLSKGIKINYIFYTINILLVFLLGFSSYFLFNAYRDYQNKSNALVNIATRLEGQISINAQGQVTLSLAKLKTIFKEDKNSIYLTIKEE